jgi:hypothetical protein
MVVATVTTQALAARRWCPGRSRRKRCEGGEETQARCLFTVATANRGCDDVRDRG